MKRQACVRVVISLALAWHVIMPAFAQETTTYTYDAKGRVTNVVRSGGPSGGASTTYQYDPADNRTNVTVAGSPNGSENGAGSGATLGSRIYVVVPINGLSLIVINQ